MTNRSARTRSGARRVRPARVTSAVVSQDARLITAEEWLGQPASGPSYGSTGNSAAPPSANEERKGRRVRVERDSRDFVFVMQLGADTLLWCEREPAGSRYVVVATGRVSGG